MQTAASPSTGRRRTALLLGVAAVVVACDQLTKFWAISALVEGVPVDLLGTTVRLVLLRNSGAAFSLGEGATWIFTLLAAAVVVGLCAASRRVRSIRWAAGLGLVLGGAAGNLVDRLTREPGVFRGHVVDFLAVGWWPVFNVADSALCVGVAVIVLAVLRGEDHLGRRHDG